MKYSFGGRCLSYRALLMLVSWRNPPALPHTVDPDLQRMIFSPEAWITPTMEELHQCLDQTSELICGRGTVYWKKREKSLLNAAKFSPRCLPAPLLPTLPGPHNMGHIITVWESKEVFLCKLHIIFDPLCPGKKRYGLFGLSPKFLTSFKILWAISSS